MKKVVALGVLFASFAGPASAAEKVVPINAITADGIGAKIGEITVSEAGKGTEFKISVTEIPDGEHGFHVHEKGDCGPGLKDGKQAAGIAAGNHYDPQVTKSHKGPHGSGHGGDLPKLTAKSKKISETVVAPNLPFADTAGRTLMIHEGGDTYSDAPESGGGKGRIACGVVPK